MLYVDKVLDFKVVLQRKDVELMNLQKEVGQNWCQVSLIRINQCVAGNQFPARARSSFKTMNSPPLLLRLLLLFYEILKKKNHYQVDFKERFLWLNLTFTFSSQSQVLIFTFVSDWNKPLSKEVMMEAAVTDKNTDNQNINCEQHQIKWMQFEWLHLLTQALWGYTQKYQLERS